MKKLGEEKDLTGEKEEAAKAAMAAKSEEKASKNAPFEPFDTTKDGHIVGEITTTKFEFAEPGDRIVGYLRLRKEINMPDNPILYEVENGDGDWAFFGSSMLNDAMELVPDGIIIDITFAEWKPSKTGGRKYKNYAIKFYEVPVAFNHEMFRVLFDPARNMIDFYESTDPRIINNLPAKDA